MTSRATPGRSRSEASREAILSAAFRLLVEGGYENLSIEGVARASGSAKTTIYRWWKAKAELAVDAFFHATEVELRLPETTCARSDFRHQILDLAEILQGPRGRALAGMLGGARNDPQLARALGERWLEPRQKWGCARMRQAAATGELKPGVEVDAALAVLYGPLYAPLLFGQPVPEVRMVERMLDIACEGVFRSQSQSVGAVDPQDVRSPAVPVPGTD